jgi:hypothetical protein
MVSKNELQYFGNHFEAIRQSDNLDIQVQISDYFITYKCSICELMGHFIHIKTVF